MIICGTVCAACNSGWPCSGADCLMVAFFLRFLSPLFLCFAQGDLIASRGWLVARSRLLPVHGDREFYRRPLFSIVS